LRLLRDELYSCVFSREFSAGDGGRVVPLPYFSILRALRRQRRGDTDMLHAAIAAGREREASLAAALESERSLAASAIETAAAAEAGLAQLQEQISSLEADAAAARAHAGRVSGDAAAEAHRAQTAADNMKAALETARAGAAELRPFKADFVSAQTAFDAFGKSHLRVLHRHSCS
jgi:hypothetical protein